MCSKTTAPSANCQACGKKIVGKVYRFTGVPDSAFCSMKCQISMTEPVGGEIVLEPITHPREKRPVYTGAVATKLHDDLGCECGVFYENQITVPKRHSFIWAHPQ
jgi:hypothetical protein